MEAMKAFLDKYEDRIHGVLSCFDRMLFRGYLPIMSGWQMAQFFDSSGIRFRELKTFLVQHAERVTRVSPTCSAMEMFPWPRTVAISPPWRKSTIPPMRSLHWIASPPASS